MEVPDSQKARASEDPGEQDGINVVAGATFDVFLSHNGDDKPDVVVLAERLRTEAGVEPFLDVWHLIPGQAWQEALEDALARSRTCAVFLGPTELGTWENEEMRAALSQHARDPEFRVIPVLLPGAVFPARGRLPPFLARLTWVDFRPGLDDADAFHRLVSGIRGISPDTGPIDVGDAEAPFRGLEVFDEAHARFFFGREALTQHLVEQLRDDRFLAVMGPSGSGKSSVVQAGLVPQLRQGSLPGSGAWPIVLVRPGAHPLESLAARLVPVLDGQGSPLPARDRILDLLRADERGLHNAVSTAVAAAPVDRRVVIVVDQFEESFTLTRDPVERDAFVASLLYASSIAGGQTVVVLTMRADFFGKCAAIPTLAARIADRDVLVPPLSPDELREAMLKPAERAELTYEQGLVDTILEDLGSGPGVLPLLQHTLLELWEGRRGRWLTNDRYREIGGVQGAIAQRAESVFQRLTPGQQSAARRILLRLTQPGDGTEDTRRRAALAELVPSGADAADTQAVVDRLTDARLLTTSDEPSGEVVDVAHEALIRGWPRLQEWVDENPAELKVHRRLTETANEWAAVGRDPSYLYTGSRLDEALGWASRSPDDPNEVERSFLAASRQLRDDEARGRVRRRRVAAAFGGAAAIVITLTAAIALFNWQRAEFNWQRAEGLLRTAEKALANAALSEGQRAAEREPARGLRLSAEGLQLAINAGLPTLPFREEVLRQLETGRYARLSLDAVGFDLIGDGRYVVVDVGDKATVWRLADGAIVTTLPGDVASEPEQFDFEDAEDDRNPNLFAVGYESDLPLELRRTVDGTTIALDGPADMAQFVGDDAVIVRFPTQPKVGAEEYNGPWTAEVRSGADGRLVATVERPFTRMWIFKGPDWATAVFEDEDSADLVSLTDGRSIVRERLGRMRRAPGNQPVFAVDTPEGRCAIIRARDGTTRFATAGRCGFLAVSPDTSTLALWVRGRPVDLLRTSDGEPYAVLNGGILSLTFSPEPGSSRIAIVQPAGTVRLIDTSTGGVVADLAVRVDPTDAQRRVTFSPDGAMVAVQAVGGVRLFDAATGAPLEVLPEYPGTTEAQGLIAVDFSRDPDASYFVATFEDGHHELFRRDLSPVALGGTADRIRFWPSAPTGPILVAYRDGEVHLLDWAIGRSLGPLGIPASPDMDWRVHSGQAAAAIVTEEITDPDKSTPVVVVGSDGRWIAVPWAWEFTAFSPDPTTSAFVARGANGESGVWDRAGEGRLLARLGLGVTFAQFDPAGRVLVVAHVTGEVYLLDLEQLRALPPFPATLSDAQLVESVCASAAGRLVSPAQVKDVTGNDSIICR